MGEDITIEQLQKLFPKGEIETYQKGHIICQIHKKVRTFRWLLEGGLEYYVPIENEENDVLVCQSSEPFSTLGQSGFGTPQRYTSKVIVASMQAVFFEIPFEAIQAYLMKGHNNILLKNIGSKLYHLLQGALLKQTELLHATQFQPFVENQKFHVSSEVVQNEIVSLMRRSPFLDFFEEKQLWKIAELAERREYEKDEVVYLQDCSTKGLFILIHGEVAIKRIENSVEIKQRSIKNSGFIFGWSCLLKANDICTAITATKTSAYFISNEHLSVLFQADDTFEGEFFQRLIWLVGNQLNAAFVRYIGLLGKHNLQAVFQLIKNNISRLSVASPLHQVTHLLKSNTTKNLAYEVLSELLYNGSGLERHIASLSMELLVEDQREYDFINGLQKVYQSVAEDKHSTPELKRKSCAALTREAFQYVPHLIEGWENLPDDSGHIFIYNHLVNDRQYTLNNNFQITLDSHFLSGMILDKKYGEPGIRTVRIGKSQEYGHQNYYDNLGFINVYTKESEQTSEVRKKETRSIFYTEAAKHLSEGYNLIVSPEGTSYRTEDSPGPFKKGAFKLALSTKKEPLIVPIVLVNFDHRIGKSLKYCKIGEPFLLSEKLASTDTSAIHSFVNNYQKSFKKEVQKARERADELFLTTKTSMPTEEPPVIWENEIKRLNRRVEKLETQENLIAFYGSSSVRLWVTMPKDLEAFNTINLGFGGSTFAWCIHYFDAIFTDVKPSKIVLYAGENDLCDGKTPQDVLADCRKLVSMIKEKYSDVALALISLKPSVERVAMIPLIIETNLLLSKYIIAELNGQYINVFAQMITSDNRPFPELYMSDGLHLNKQGYVIWSNVIKSALQGVDNLELESDL